MDNNQSTAPARTPEQKEHFTKALAGLKAPLDAKDIKQRQGHRDRNGNPVMLDYVEWPTVCGILDEHAPDWSHKIVNLQLIGDVVVVAVAITIDGVTREGIGTGGAEDSELAVKKAEHDALSY